MYSIPFITKTNFTEKYLQVFPVNSKKFNDLITALKEVFTSFGVIKTNSIEELTAANGVLVDGVTLKDGGIKLASSYSSTPGATHTINKPAGRCVVAHGATAGLATLTVTITNSFVAADSIVVASISEYGGLGKPVVADVSPADGSLVVEIYNAHASEALSANFVLNFAILE